MQKERQAREAAEKEKNELLERLNRLEEEAIKARDGITSPSNSPLSIFISSYLIITTK